MEYRALSRGGEQISVIGLGMGGMNKDSISEDEIEALIRKAVAGGVNFFDLCAGTKHVYAPFGRAIAEQRDKIYFQLHFGAVYNKASEYGWSRDFHTIQRTFEWELEEMQTDYADMGFLHCVDEDRDFDKLISGGVLDTGLVDMMMFSINPAYDFEQGDDYGIGTVNERFSLFQRCAAEGVGISVMKPFHAGKLLSAETSPFRKRLTHYQCIQYALDRPGVLTVVPGVRTMEDLDVLLGFSDASAEEKDYSVVGNFTAEHISGKCVYCNHCQPCPAGIDIGLVNKYLDLAQVGDKLAAGHYEKLGVDASACLHCGHCDSRCPFSVKQSAHMDEIADYFSKKEDAI